MNRARRLAIAVSSALTLLVGSSLPASAAPGDVDGTFGLLTHPHADLDNGVGITRGPEGRFVIAWGAGDQVGVFGFLGTGADDGGYGTGGTSSITIPGATSVGVVDSAVDPTGRTVVVGFADFPTTTRMLVARFTVTGDPDTTFSGDGVATISFSRGEAYAYDVVFRGGRLYVCGQVYTGGDAPADVVVVRLNGAGALDPAFGSGGRRVYKVPDGFAGDDFANAIIPVANGRFVLAGGVSSLQGINTLVMRIHGDGRPDRSFKGDGYHIMDLRKAGTDYAADAEGDGSKLVLGVSGSSTGEKPKIVRLRADGSRDATFSGDGVGTYPLFIYSFFPMREIEVDANHRVFAVGYVNHLAGFRVRANGQLASAFGDGGLASNPATSASAWDTMLRGGLLYVTGVQGNTAVVATRYLL